MAREFISANKRYMSAAMTEDYFSDMGLEGLRTYEIHDVDRDGPFYLCNVPAEPLSLCRGGGYHPVHLGDTVQERRHIIIYKLGWGLDGTV